MTPRPIRLLAEPLRRRIAMSVVDLFNDRGRGEKPVARRPDGLFGPDAVAWRVHGDVGAMMVGGVSSLLLQMLMPEVLAGVWDHSNFRADMHGRLRRTARFIATTTYASRPDAEAAIDRVRRIHDAVGGTLPDGMPYRANDPTALAWVHVTETTSFLAAWRRYGEPGMSMADRDRYFAEMATIGTALGADPVPSDVRSAAALIADMRPRLATDRRTREVAALVLRQRGSNPVMASAQHLLSAAAIDLLPEWARAMHGFPAPLVGRALARTGTRALAGTLRWAFQRP
ncbi:oxygenase MpaB family protein [Sphingomonas bacterium]|uniref:oxygenase MpaB family protein n=1 Tax=Sphingomonas bacterium TaxID=1895847 RepID=UPI00349FE2A3